jgi:CheY-like chemotaxis protein
MLARTALTPGQGELMEVMRASASDFERVMSDVLDFARMQSDDMSVADGHFHLGETVRDVARLFELRLMAKQVTFHIEIAPEAERMVRGDRLRVKQVLNNLMSNALKFTAVGSVTLSAARAEDGAMRLAVTDTGVGFAHKDKDRIFAGFEQGDGSATRAYGGAGLGLAISRRLALMMEGTLDAAANPGGGSVFECRLPLPEVEAEQPIAAGGDDAPVERRIRVLIVDDHPVNRKVAELMLSQVGAEIIEAVNGEEACQAFKAEPFDLILMDIQMPVMDGLTATRQIRALEAERGQTRTPILMVTANALPEHVDASREAGADRHLAKPLQIETLFEAMNETLSDEAA